MRLARHRAWLYAALPALLLTLPTPSSSQEEIRNPARLELFEIQPNGDGTATITLRTSIDAPGIARLRLHPPVEFEILGDNVRSDLPVPGSIGAEWTVTLPARGSYLIQASVQIEGANPGPRPEFAEFETFPLYVDIGEGAVRSQANTPPASSHDPVTPVERAEFPKLTPIPVDPGLFGEGGGSPQIRLEQREMEGEGTTTTYDIYVFIYGNIQFLHGDGCLGSPYWGVPGDGVYLDWDFDNDPSTGYTPYAGGGILHAGYDITEMDGSYYFAFHFLSSVPASSYSDVIRVYCNRGNGDAFNGDTGSGGWFPTYYYLDISSATDWIYHTGADVNVPAHDGGALRFLTRARLFSQNELGYTPQGQNRYYIRTNESNSFFCCSGECTNGPQPGVPFILFNRIPDAHVGYHEHGHYTDCQNLYDLPYDWGGSHWFQLVTTENTAWVEGWAEFYDAAAMLYWARQENPQHVEPERTYQFLEETQSSLPTGVDRKRVEGAIASYMFNLYDDTALRQPGYTGDNDDLDISGSAILNAMNVAEFQSCNIFGGNCSNMIANFRDAILSSTNSLTDVSVNSMYNYFLGESGVPRSATPDWLTVNGADVARTLSWPDRTSPTSVGYTCWTIHPQRNNETGVEVWRMSGGGSWDGTLNGYTLVHTTGADATSWTDTAPDRLTQSYVVVATNTAGRSVPMAHAVWPEAPDAAISGPGTVGAGNHTWTATATGGTSPYSYAWYTGPANCSGPWTYRNSGTTLIYATTSDFCIKLEAQGADGSTGTETKFVDRTGGTGCPYLYTATADGFEVENTLLRAVAQPDARSLASDVSDPYVLKNQPDVADGRVRFAIREFEQEHSFLNRLELTAVDHSIGSHVGVLSDGGLAIYDGVVAPVSAYDDQGRDRLAEVVAEDGVLFEGRPGDALTVQFRRADLGEDLAVLLGGTAKRKPDISDPPGGDGPGILIVLPESTSPDKILTRWQPRELSGLALAPMELEKSANPEDLVTVRFEWLTRHDLDQAGIYLPSTAKFSTTDLPLLSVGKGEADVTSQLLRTDEAWVELLPGEEIQAAFDAGSRSQGSERAYLLRIDGHYFRMPADEPVAAASAEFRFDGLAPNPLRAQNGAKISFSIAREAPVTLRIFDVTGREVRALVSGEVQVAGPHEVHWDGRNSEGRSLRPGVYFTRLQAGSDVITRKLVILE